MGKVSPAYGMIGTVVGLIAMLYNMGEDMSAIGPSMSIALITTLYGVLFATAIFNPFADKISRNMELQIINYRIDVEFIPTRSTSASSKLGWAVAEMRLLRFASCP